jgi:hypothetical protein
MRTLTKISRLLVALGFSTTAIAIPVKNFHLIVADLVLLTLFFLLTVTGQLTANVKFIIILTIYLVVSLITAYLNDYSLTHAVISYIALNIYAATLTSVFNLHKGRMDKLISMYLAVAFIASVVAVFQELSFLLDFKSGYDLKWLFNGYANLTYSGIFLKVPSIFTEPGYLAPFLIPAAYLSVKSLVFGSGEVSRTVVIFILLAIIFTFSLIGYFGLLLALFILFRKNILIALLATGLFIVYGMLNVQSIKPRVDAFINTFQSGLMINYNFSSLVLILNYHISKEAFKQNPVLGAGIDGYEMMSDRIIDRGFSEHVLNKFTKMNQPEYLMVKDGGNLFFRILVEFGLTGIILITFFLWRNFSPTNYEKHIQFMCLIFIMTYAVRTGQYLRLELWFFTMMFLKINEDAPRPVEALTQTPNIDTTDKGNS